MFAIIQTGGKQYRVSPGEKIKIEKIDAQDKAKFIFDKVLLIADDKETKIGSPYVKGAKVEAEILRQGRERKKIVFRYHSKTRYHKKKGHRQHFTEAKIVAIK